MSQDPYEILADATVAMLSAGDELVAAMKAKGMSRAEAWTFLSSTPAEAESARVRAAHFDVLWPEET